MEHHESAASIDWRVNVLKLPWLPSILSNPRLNPCRLFAATEMAFVEKEYWIMHYNRCCRCKPGVVRLKSTDIMTLSAVMVKMEQTKTRRPQMRSSAAR